MIITGLPDLPPDADGATIQGVYYTRAQYETLQAETRTRSPKSPDFDQIARRIYVESLGVNASSHQPEIAHVVAQLRLVWNARGAADREEIDGLKARVAELEALLDEVPPGT